MARVCLGRRSRGAYLDAVRCVRCRISRPDYALLVLVEQTELCPLVGVYDGKNAGNALPDVVDAGELGGGTSGDLASPQADQLPSQSVSIFLCIPPFRRVGGPTISTPGAGSSTPPWTCSTAGRSSAAVVSIRSDERFGLGFASAGTYNFASRLEHRLLAKDSMNVETRMRSGGLSQQTQVLPCSTPQRPISIGTKNNRRARV